VRSRAIGVVATGRAVAASETATAGRAAFGGVTTTRPADRIMATGSPRRGRAAVAEATMTGATVEAVLEGTVEGTVEVTVEVTGEATGEVAETAEGTTTARLRRTVTGAAAPVATIGTIGTVVAEGAAVSVSAEIAMRAAGIGAGGETPAAIATARTRGPQSGPVFS